MTPPPIGETLHAAINFDLGPIKLRRREGEQFMTRTERLDFFILFFIFGVLVAGTSSFSVFISQIFVRTLAALPHARRPTDSFAKVPYGYSDVITGLIGGIFLLSGLLAAILAAPLFDRVLIHYLAKTVKSALPLLSIAWICLIFVGGSNSLALY